MAAMFVNGSGQNQQSLQRIFHRCFLPSFVSFGQAVTEEKIFRNRSIRNKNCLWQPCLLMVRDKISNFIEDLSQMLPTKFRFIWNSSYRGEDFQKSTNQKQQLPVVAMFVNESGRNQHSLQRTFQGCSLPSFDSFGQAVSEEKILQKSTNQKQEWSVAAMFVNESGRNEQYSQRTCHRCFLPSFSSFGQAVAEKIFWKSTNQKQELPMVTMFVNGSGRNKHSF